jgi:hypothetical protein
LLAGIWDVYSSILRLRISIDGIHAFVYVYFLLVSFFLIALFLFMSGHKSWVFFSGVDKEEPKAVKTRVEN